MSKCIRCNAEIKDSNNFCPKCGHDQRVEYNSNDTGNHSFLIVLCVLTIIGSLFSIARAFFYEIVAYFSPDHTYLRGWVYAISSVGTLFGAIFMLGKKLKGLYIYSISQLIYFVSVIYACLVYEDLFVGSGLIASYIALYFLVPSAVFLVLYWLKVNRKHLK